MIVLPERAALFLDLDGTLLDIAATPDGVLVPASLPAILLRVRRRCDDALAIVSGRPIAEVDALLPDLAYAVAGEHGGVLRMAPGAAEIRAATEPVPASWLAGAAALVAEHPGSLLERKQHGFVLHYRATPASGPVFERFLQDRLTPTIAAWPHHVLGASLMAWEIKPVGIDKGRAVEALMAAAPFAGRVPVFIGDDVTDEDGMRAARALGGLGLRVQDWFGDATGVRSWLAETA